MAVTAVNAFGGGGDVNSTWYSTASYAFSSSKLYTLSVYIFSGTLGTVTSVAGGGLTWVQVTTRAFSTEATPLNRLDLWRAMSTVTATGSVTIGLSKIHSRAAWVCDEWIGMFTTGANGANAVAQSVVTSTNLSTQITATLAGLSSLSAAYGVFAVPSFTSNAIAPGAGYTTLSTGRGAAEAAIILTEYDSTGTTVVNVSTINTAIGGIAIEVLNSTGAAPSAAIRQLKAHYLTGQGQNRFMGNFVEFVFVTEKTGYCYEN